MKQITKLITIISLIGIISIISSCSKSCPDPSTKTTYVDRSYLPDIIPYSDTSTRLFLKNGKDTLLFKSLGLNQSFEEGSTITSIECTEFYKNEKLLLRMSASDTDFFDIVYNAKLDGFSEVYINVNNKSKTRGYGYSEFRKPYPPIYSVNILNIKYDTIINLPEQNMVVYIKPKYSVLMLKTSSVTYELIK
ncbi:MAG: hypothetical protein ACOYMA_07200 [Bacteroidia bacterium]